MAGQGEDAAHDSYNEFSITGIVSMHWAKQQAVARNLKARAWRLLECPTASSSVPVTATDPYGRPPLPRRRHGSRPIVARSPIPRRRLIQLMPAKKESRATRVPAKTMEEAVDALAKSSQHLRGQGKAGRASKKVQPSLKLTEAPKPTKSKKNKGAAGPSTASAGTAPSKIAAEVEREEDCKPMEKRATQGIAIAKAASKASSSRCKQTQYDDSYEYYTESASESQSRAQQMEPCKRARAEYMTAGCVILLTTL